jgi:RNA polymerase sigma factor (sigma-70 family)
MVAALTVHDLPLLELESACVRETRRFRERGASDARFCLEIFRRALQHSVASGSAPMRSPTYADEAARATLVRIYTEYIRAQINRKALGQQAIDDLIQEVWRNFWMAANGGLLFPTLEAALSYLKLATASVVIKHLRRVQSRAREDSIQAMSAETGEAPLPAPDEGPFNAHIRQRFRARVRELLGATLEGEIYWLRYGHGYSPREIAALLAKTPHNADDRLTARRVSDILERCIQRLSADPEIRDLLQAD